jgi:hypothetical protein
MIPSNWLASNSKRSSPNRTTTTAFAAFAAAAAASAVAASGSAQSNSNIHKPKHASSTAPKEPDSAMATSSAVAVTADDFDALLAKELTCLTIQERDIVLQEIHGVADKVVEDPFLVAHSLAQLEATLWRLQQQQQQQRPEEEDMAAYWQAHAMNPSYTTNAQFRLQFLRAERFNVPATAQRMARYFRQKLIILGPENLGKAHFTLDDLSDDDKCALECGYMQWLSQRDTSGRAIFFCAIPLRNWKDRSNVVRMSI